MECEGWHPLPARVARDGIGRKNGKGSLVSAAKATERNTEEYCNMIYVGSVLLLPVTVSKQLLPFLDKAFTGHHHPLLQVIG